MKKTFVLLISLVFVFAFCFGSSAETEEGVIAGQTFAWNDSSDNARAWMLSKGVSPDGLWKYQMYVLDRNVYLGLNKLNSNGFAWSKTPGEDGVGGARVRNCGVNFHPGQTADVVKAFTCPSGGTVEVVSVLARETDVLAQETGVSFRVYLGKELVYPADGSAYVVIDTKEPQTFTFTLDVARDQVLFFHIGAIDGNISGDSTDMTNEITYKLVNNRSIESTIDTTPTIMCTYRTWSVPLQSIPASETGEPRFPIVWVSVSVVIAVLVLGIVVAVVRGKRKK